MYIYTQHPDTVMSPGFWNLRAHLLSNERSVWPSMLIPVFGLSFLIYKI